MPHYNVQHEGKWACFSSIPDGFITDFMDRAKYEEWRKNTYQGHNLRPLEESNQLTVAEAISNARLVRSRKEWLEEMDEIGLKEYARAWETSEKERKS